KRCLAKIGKSACDQAFSHLQSLLQRWISHVKCVRGRGVRFVNRPVGLKSWVQVWFIQKYWKWPVMIRKYILVLLLGWDQIVLLCCNMASMIFVSFIQMIFDF